MEITKGGRGKKAPYETTHVRVPYQLKPYLEMMIEAYKERVEADGVSEVEPHYVDAVIAGLNSLREFFEPVSSSCLPSLSDSTEAAAQFVRDKKSASEALAKLLTTIYQVKVTKEELRNKANRSLD